MRLLNNSSNFFRACLVKERVANLDAYDVISIKIEHQTYRNTLQSLLEGERHSSCDDKTVHLCLSVEHFMGKGREIPTLSNMFSIS